jgi:predicted RNA binding protein YcfA (HicA-like mRNA interferase family)
MKIPGDLSGIGLAKKLEKYGYQITRQTGSHIRLTTILNGEHHITIPAHDPLKIGTLSAILTAVSAHLEMTKTEIVELLF